MTESSPNPGGKQQQIVSISTVAHTKMTLHAAKKHTTQIHGILIGHFTGAEEIGSDTGAPLLSIHDAIPVCHEAPTKPIVDMALRLTDEYCRFLEGGSKQVVGWYSAPERLSDDKPGQSALRITASIGSRLASQGNEEKRSSGGPPAIPPHAEPVLFLVENRALANLLCKEKSEKASSPEDVAIKVYGRDVRKHWLRPISGENLRVSGAVAGWSACAHTARTAFEMYEAGKLPLFDFADHLEGGSDQVQETDWLRNIAITEFARKYS